MSDPQPLLSLYHIDGQDLLAKHTEESNASLKTRETQEEEVSTVVECLGKA